MFAQIYMASFVYNYSTIHFVLQIRLNFRKNFDCTDSRKFLKLCNIVSLTTNDKEKKEKEKKYSRFLFVCLFSADTEAKKQMRIRKIITD